MVLFIFLSPPIKTHLTASNNMPFRFGYDSTTQKYGYITESGGADTFNPFNSDANGTLTISGTLYGSAWVSPGSWSAPNNPNDPGTCKTSGTMTINIKVTNGVASLQSISGNTPAKYQLYQESGNWGLGVTRFTVTSVTWTPD